MRNAIYTVLFTINKMKAYLNLPLFFFNKILVSSKPSLGGPSGNIVVGLSFSGMVDRIKTNAFAENQLTKITSFHVVRLALKISQPLLKVRMNDASGPPAITRSSLALDRLSLS